jgi:hypothetical protein
MREFELDLEQARQELTQDPGDHARILSTLPSSSSWWEVGLRASTIAARLGMDRVDVDLRLRDLLRAGMVTAHGGWWRRIDA